MNLTRTFDAESEPLSLTDVKTQLRITTTDDDDAIRMFIAGIRKETEWYIGKTLITTIWEYKRDGFGVEFCLPMPPIQSISSVSYVDSDGANQTLAASGYQFDKAGRMRASYGNSFPSTRSQYDAVTVTYVAGETNAGNVDEDIKLAMLLWIGACDINREDNVIGTIISEIPNSARNILASHRRLSL